MSDIAQIGCIACLIVVALVFVIGHIEDRRNQSKLDNWRKPE